MEFIGDIYAHRGGTGKPVISFEFFTPKTLEGERALFEKTLPALARCKPAFCSVTWGAGGSTRQKTLEMVDRIQREFGIAAMAHLTCVESNRAQIVELLDRAKALGIKNVLALRGDPPAGSGEFKRPQGGFQHAYELVQLAREVDGFSIGVAGFPEGHIECKEGRHVDWERLKFKIECGAHFVITQLFFDNSFFYDFRDHLTRQLGVNVPLVPGLIPILSAGQVRKFVSICGATLPDPLVRRLEELGDNDAAVAEYGIEYATRQCADLLDRGVPGIHFYALNKARSSIRILENLGLAG